MVHVSNGSYFGGVLIRALEANEPTFEFKRFLDISAFKCSSKTLGHNNTVMSQAPFRQTWRHINRELLNFESTSRCKIEHWIKKIDKT
uniref:Uncharacterized protein n=1 Tax=Bracon brevicornis TaxID=1563983 RepID=A0A6V7M1H6_9HYME